MSTNDVRVPSLVGGIPNQTDLAPSIIFCVAYGLSLIPAIYRFMHKDSRTWTLTMGTLPFAIERIVVFGIRASQSHVHHPGEALSKGKLVYQQVSFALGYVAFASDAVALIRAVLVNTTLEDPRRGSVDLAKRRKLYRQIMIFVGLTWLTVSVPGAVAYSKMPGSGEHQDQADQLYRLRYVSAAMALFFYIAYTCILLLVRRRIQWLDARAINWIILVLCISAIVPIYRLTVLHYTTSILNILPSSGPLYPANSLTTPASKATFYIFHSLPELALACLMNSINMRRIFNTGPFGDWRGSDHSKAGIPRLRENGVYVDGVGVLPRDGRPGKEGKYYEKYGESKGQSHTQAGKGKWWTRGMGMGRRTSEQSDDATVVGRPSDAGMGRAA